jgi:hypothetical protein
VYQLDYTIQVAGTYLLEIMVQPGGTGPFYHIKDSNLVVVCAVNEVDAANTELSGEGVTDSMAGVVASFTVTLFDVGQNQRESGGDSILVEISDGVLDISAIEVFDNSDGTYTVDYRIDVATTYTLQVTVNGDIDNIKSSTITTVPNIPDAATSTLATVTPILQDSYTAVDVVVYDAYSNLIQGE